MRHREPQSGVARILMSIYHGFVANAPLKDELRKGLFMEGGETDPPF